MIYGGGGRVLWDAGCCPKMVVGCGMRYEIQEGCGMLAINIASGCGMLGKIWMGCGMLGKIWKGCGMQDPCVPPLYADVAGKKKIYGAHV